MILDIGDLEIEVEAVDSIYGQLVTEILGPYEFDSIRFRKGDVVLDIGAHKGITSIYLAKRWPGLRIYAFEPVPENFEVLQRHLEMNEVRNVKAYQLAVTADGRRFPMIRGNHTAEGSGWFDPGAVGRAFIARSISVPAILGKFHIRRVKLLKLDCEGAEHEILADSKSWMPRVSHVRAEIHMIPPLVEEGYTAEGTMATVPEAKARWQLIEHPTLLGTI